MVTHSLNKSSSNFVFNKDARMYVCKAGHMSVKKTFSGKNITAAVLSYYFDVEKCKLCPYRDVCYKEGSKTRSYFVTLLSKIHSEQQEFQETEEFKAFAKERYMIEAKNSELKHDHGYDVPLVGAC